MRVLHVIDKMDPKLGGVSQAVRTIITGLRQVGIENEVVSLDDANEAFILQEKFTIHALGPGKTSWSFSSHLYPWLFKNLFNYDFVILHGLWLFNGYALSRVLRQKVKRGKQGVRETKRFPKSFVMPHGMLDPYFQRTSVRKIKVLRNWLYWKLIERHLIERVDGLLFTAVKEKELAGSTFLPYKPKNEIVVGLGVEQPPEYEPSMAAAFKQISTALNDDPYLLFLGRIDSKKGVDILIRAFSRVKSEGDTPLKLVVAGPGLETPYGKSIKEYVTSSNLEDSVFFVGMLSGFAKWGAFYGCNAFILPSHQENFGIAVVEALACGKPVLISDQINIFNEIKASHAGLIAKDTLEGTVSLIKSWLQLTDTERKLMSTNAKAVYLNAFSVSLTAKQLAASLKMS